ncbi:MAG: NAD-dependent epimerase/dehydratase family protein [Deltaproteobacteria bacterium]|nr:NAD-dependent epimerase/dehydratase family protein [Deltaproteobacteria bacterium]
MKCLVTGAAGFIGSSLSERLIKEGHEVRGIDCFVPYYPKACKLENLAALRDSAAFEFFEEDLNQTDLSVRLRDIEWVFHQAAQAGVRASWGDTFESYVQHNILATQRLLEAAKSCPTLKKFVCASSSSIYGDAEVFPTAESQLPRPVSPYGVTKLAAEHLAVLYASGFGVPTVSLRYFTVYGPRQRPDMAFHRFIKAGFCHQPITLYGDGEQSRDFTFITDALEANLLAAVHGEPGQVFNVGGGSVISVNHVIELLRRHFPDLQVTYLERQAGDARHTSADISRAKSLLGYAPKVAIEEGLEREIEWLRSVAA